MVVIFVYVKMEKHGNIAIEVIYIVLIWALKVINVGRIFGIYAIC